jgi:hypothetical protein
LRHFFSYSLVRELWLLSLALMALSTQAQPAARLDVGTTADKLQAGEPVLVTVRAITPAGTVTTNCPTMVRLGFVQQETNRPVISELVRTSDGKATVEVTNPWDEACDMSGWELQVLETYLELSAGDPPITRLSVPPGTVIPGQSTFTWSDIGAAPGAYPSFVSEKPLSPRNSSLGLVRLYDSAGSLVDELFCYPWQSAPPGALWVGPSTNATYAANQSISRLGAANHFSKGDWQAGEATLNTLNPALLVPWKHGAKYVPALPSELQLTNGAWTGFVIVPSSLAGRACLNVDTGTGISGQSAPLEVFPDEQMNLSLLHAPSAAREAVAGYCGEVSVSFPTPHENDLDIRLGLSVTNEFMAPQLITLRAGLTNVTFALTNVNDGVPDGDALVILSAVAEGYRSASLQLVNEDAQLGVIQIEFPTKLDEDAGFISQSARVRLFGETLHDIVVRLTAEPPVTVPETLIIPAGRTSASFRPRVGDDRVVNRLPRTAHVRAQTGEWPVATATVTITDDEDPCFEVIVPPTTREGTTNNGVIRVRVPREWPTKFELKAVGGRLSLPAEVTLAAGELEVPFWLGLVSNGQPEPNSMVTIEASYAPEKRAQAETQLIDADLSFSALNLSYLPDVLLSGQRYPLRATVVNGYNAPQQTNFSGTARPLTSTNVARLVEDPNPLYFTSGVWSNNISLLGEGSDLYFEVEALGLRANDGPFTLLSGFSTEAQVAAAVPSADGKILFALANQDGDSTTELREYAFPTGDRGRTLALPADLRIIEISDAGDVAWLASYSGRMIQVDLTRWAILGDYQLFSPTNDLELADLTISPGERDKVLALTHTRGSNVTLVVCESGVPSSLRAALPSGGPWFDLIRGRTADEFFCCSRYFITRLLVSTSGVELVGTQTVGYTSPGLTLGGGRLYLRNGDVRDPDTLDLLSRVDAAQRADWCLPFTTANVMIRGDSRSVNAYDLTSGEWLGYHFLPYAPTSVLCAWGESGFVFAGNGGRSMLVVESPLLRKERPDLAVFCDAPASAVLQDAEGHQFPLVVTYTITNQSSVSAPGVKLGFPVWPEVRLGTLGPWESRQFSTTNSYWQGITTLEATVACVVPDAHTNDNSLRLLVRVDPPDYPGAKTVLLRANHLIRAPGGDRLYAAVSRDEQWWQPGVAVVNPFNAKIEAIIPVGTDPRQIELSADGSQLYVRLGTNTLTQWDLTTRTENMRLTFTNESVLHFAMLPGSNTSFVIATTQRIAVYDETTPRTEEYTVGAATRHLGFASGDLWVTEETGLNRFKVTPEGLRSEILRIRSGYVRFTTDGRYLFFYDLYSIYDTVEMKDIFGPARGPLYPDPDLPALYRGEGSRIYRHSPDDFSTLDFEGVPGQAVLPEDIVRWGELGLAFRSWDRLVFMERSVAATPGITDLGVEVTAPTNAVAWEETAWPVSITNHSDFTAVRVVLRIAAQGLQDSQEQGVPYPGLRWTREFDLGSLPGHATQTYYVRGWSAPGAVTVSASLAVAPTDIVLSNNQSYASVDLGFLSSDVEIEALEAPIAVRLGQTFNIGVRFTNHGPGRAAHAFIYPAVSQGTEFVGLVEGSAQMKDSGVWLDKVAPGEHRDVTLQYKAKKAGIWSLEHTGKAAAEDPAPANPEGRTIISVAGPLTPELITRIEIPQSVVWDGSLNRLLSFLRKDVYVINPEDLSIEKVIHLSTNVVGLATCDNGRHAWVRIDRETIARLDLTAGSADFSFLSGDERPGHEEDRTVSIAVPPGTSNLVVTTMKEAVGLTSRLRVYLDGAPLPDEYGPLGDVMVSAGVTFDPEGHLYVAAGKTLRELAITATGLVELRNLDREGAYYYYGPGLSYARGHIVYVNGIVYDIETGAQDVSRYLTDSLVGDHPSGLLYTATDSQGQADMTPAGVRWWDVSTSTLLGRISLPGEPRVINQILPMGTNGFLVSGISGGSFWYVRSHRERTLPDLEIGLRNVPATAETNVPFCTVVTLTNRSSLGALDACIVLDPGPSLAITGRLGSVTIPTPLAPRGATNVTVWMAASSLGTATLTVRSIIESNTFISGASGSISVQVPPPPLLQLDTLTIKEGSMLNLSPIVARLACPAQTNLALSFVVTPLDATLDDFIAFGGTFEFAAGDITAKAYILSGDVIPERNKTALLTFTSGNIQPAVTNAIITILDDDVPSLSVANVTVVEGNSTFTNAGFRFQLSSPTPYPVLVEFQTIPGSATEYQDYLPRRGVIEIPPGTNTIILSVPVLGDSLFETLESAQLLVLAVTNAVLANYAATLNIHNDDSPAAPILRLAGFTESDIVLECESEAGASYQLQSRADLDYGAWTNQGPIVIGRGGVETWTISRPEASRAYYRIRAK